MAAASFPPLSLKILSSGNFALTSPRTCIYVGVAHGCTGITGSSQMSTVLVGVVQDYTGATGTSQRSTALGRLCKFSNIYNLYPVIIGIEYYMAV